MPDNVNTFEARPVSRFFRFDWNFAHRIAKTPALEPASLLISLMPIIRHIRLIYPYVSSIWVLWSASVFFLLATFILKIRTPPFIQEYQNYAQFESQGHSHRWIVWEFYNKLDSLSDPDYVVRETKAKLITLPCSDLVDLDVCRVFPIFGAPSGRPVEVAKPLQVGRDIYVPIRIDNQKFVLAMQEGDPCLGQKQKELFWILLSQFAKERRVWRAIVWILFGISALLYVTTVASNVLRVIVGESLFSMLHVLVNKFAELPPCLFEIPVCFGERIN